MCSEPWKDDRLPGHLGVIWITRRMFLASTALARDDELPDSHYRDPLRSHAHKWRVVASRVAIVQLLSFRSWRNTQYIGTPVDEFHQDPLVDDLIVLFGKGDMSFQHSRKMDLNAK